MRVQICIVGAGLVGSFQALLLAEAGLDVLVIDPAEDLGTPLEPVSDVETLVQAQTQLRVSAISLSNLKQLKRLKVWSRLDPPAFHYFSGIAVWQSAASAPLRLDARTLGQPYLGAIVENKALQQAIVDQLKQLPNVQIWRARRVTQIDFKPDQADLHLSDGEQIQASLLIAADGAHSFVCRHLGMPRIQGDYQQSALVTWIQTESAHAHIARQVFGHNQVLGVLPLSDPNRCSIVWSLPRAKIESIAAQARSDTTGFCVDLRACLGAHSDLGRITDAYARPLVFDLKSHHLVDYFYNRAVFVGDAAHTLHPLAGQGLNLGFYDAVCLKETLCYARDRRADYGADAVLKRYQARRRGHNMEMMGLMQRFLDLSNSPVLWEMGSCLVQQSTWLQKQLMRQACGV
jgi:2-octaprenylphenol hydroxylase